MRTARNVALASLCACVVAVRHPVPRAQAPADRPFDTLAELVTAKMREYHVPGVALGVLRDGQTRVRGFGVTNADDPQPVTPETIFPLASISKTVTATAMMRLIEQGRVDLHAPVRKYLPEFRTQDEAVSRDVTIWHLLTHTSGWEGQLSAVDRREELLHVSALNVLVRGAALVREDLLDEPASALLPVALENHVERLRRVLLDCAEERVRDVGLQIAVLPAAAAVVAKRCAGHRGRCEHRDHGDSHAGPPAAATPECVRTRLALRAASPKRVRAITRFRRS